jgi:hypothetical protein
MKRPLQWVLPGTRQRPQPFDLVEHDLRLAKEAAAVDGRCGGARTALEQLYAELVLELGDLSTQGGLTDMATRSGTAELALAGEADRVFEVAQVHRQSYRSQLSIR